MEHSSSTKDRKIIKKDLVILEGRKQGYPEAMVIHNDMCFATLIKVMTYKCAVTVVQVLFSAHLNGPHMPIIPPPPQFLRQTGMVLQAGYGAAGRVWCYRQGMVLQAGYGATFEVNYKGCT